MNNIKKRLILFVSMCVISALALTVHASDITVRTVILHSIVGDNATLSNGGPRTFTPRQGQRLNGGSILSTHIDTFIELNIDNNSYMEMDQQSRIALTSLGRRLTISVQSGNAFMRIADQNEGYSIESRVGSIGLVAQSAMYTIGRDTTDIIAITMLSGYGEVLIGDFQLPLNAGHMIRVYDDILDDTANNALEEGLVIVSDLALEYMNLFTLQAIQSNSEYLLEEGIVTYEMLEALPELIYLREEEQQALQEKALRELERLENTLTEITPWTPPIIITTPEPEVTPTPFFPRTPVVISPSGLSVSNSSPSRLGFENRH